MEYICANSSFSLQLIDETLTFLFSFQLDFIIYRRKTSSRELFFSAHSFRRSFSARFHCIDKKNCTKSFTIWFAAFCCCRKNNVEQKTIMKKKPWWHILHANGKPRLFCCCCFFLSPFFRIGNGNMSMFLCAC